MKIQIQQVTSRVLDERRNVLSELTTETYIVYPDEGKVLREISTGRIFNHHINVSNKLELKNFEEIDKPLK